MTEASNAGPNGRIGQVLEGRWQLERILGSGGTATVYAARDASGQAAAVKILHDDIAAHTDLRERFAREVAVTSRLEHPAIVRVLEDRTERAELAYIAMELLEGETVGERARRGPIALEDLLGWLEQVLDVLVLAHAAGIIHRDLKPDNLFVTRSGQLKVLDFGVARFRDPSGRGALTRTGLAIGTAPYMSPEQALGKSNEIDGRTDLFALGAIAFRLLTGRRVHEGRTDAEVLAAMATKPAPPIASVKPTVPSGVAAIVDVALGFDRSARYPDAVTMLADVRAVAAGGTPRHASAVLAASEQPTVAPGQPLDGGRTPTPATPGPTAADAGTDTDPLIGQVIARNYRILSLLGVGGMGAVYRAEHIHIRKVFALKVLHREMTYVPEVVARFEREAIAASRIEHPNVAAATDFGKLEDGSCYLVLEYIEGVSLTRVLRQERALSPRRAALIAAQVTSALAAAHAAGIVHRDLKPDNILLVPRPDGTEQVKVLDFGIAKVSATDLVGQPALTRVGSVFGTPEYMSPEQAMGQAVDHRADLYALGVMLYEMLAGQLPFESDDIVVLLGKHMTAPPPPLPSSLDPQLAALTLQLLEKSAERRPADAALVSATLEAIATQTSSIALPVSRSALAHGPTYFDVAAPPSRLDAPQASPAPSVVESVPQRSDSVLALLQREVEVGGQRVPTWTLVGAAGFVLLGAALAVGVVRAAAGTAGPAPSASAELGSLGSSRVAAVAVSRAVDRHATPPEAPATGTAAGTAEDYVQATTLAREGKLGLAIAAYTRAVTKDPSLAQDPRLLGDVRRAAEDPAAHRAALALASQLGAPGADLLYDVATKSPQKAFNASARATLPKVRATASPALAIALDLESAAGCTAFAKLLPRAITHADERSLPKLMPLTKTDGCPSGGLMGRFSRKADCFACLRSDSKLGDAIAAAKQRPAPTFAPRAP